VQFRIAANERHSAETPRSGGYEAFCGGGDRI
jgi:hypothetical protein